MLGDAQQLRQVIHNLLQNAQDATEGPSGDDSAAPVIIRTRMSDSGQRVRLIVQDNGPGFAESILKRAFEPYVTTKSKGTGLGLAVVKKIADEHGARVRLVNLESPDGDAADEGTAVSAPTVIQGAQVSLSFSKFAPTDAHTAAATPDVDIVH